MTKYRYSTDERPLTEDELAEREEDRQRHLEQFNQVLHEAKRDIKALQEEDLPEADEKDKKGERNHKIDWLLDVVHAAKADIKDCEERPPKTTIVEQIRVEEGHPQYEYGWEAPAFTSKVPIRKGHEPPEEVGAIVTNVKSEEEGE